MKFGSQREQALEKVGLIKTIRLILCAVDGIRDGMCSFRGCLWERV